MAVAAAGDGIVVGRCGQCSLVLYDRVVGFVWGILYEFCMRGMFQNLLMAVACLVSALRMDKDENECMNNDDDGNDVVEKTMLRYCLAFCSPFVERCKTDGGACVHWFEISNSVRYVRYLYHTEKGKKSFYGTDFSTVVRDRSMPSKKETNEEEESSKFSRDGPF